MMMKGKQKVGKGGGKGMMMKRKRKADGIFGKGGGKGMMMKKKSGKGSGKGKGGGGKGMMKKKSGKGGKGGESGKGGKGGKGMQKKKSGKAKGSRKLVESTQDGLDSAVDQVTDEYMLLEMEAGRGNLKDPPSSRQRHRLRRATKNDPAVDDTSGETTRRLKSKGKGGSSKGKQSGKGSSSSMSSKGKGSSIRKRGYFDEDCDKGPSPSTSSTRTFDIFDLAANAYAVSVCRYDPTTGMYESVCVDSYDIDAMAMQYDISCGCCTNEDEPGEKPDFCSAARDSSGGPTTSPTSSAQPSMVPTSFPTATIAPSSGPSTSAEPSTQPSKPPTSGPTSSPTAFPTSTPSSVPSRFPSNVPTFTVLPSSSPSLQPSVSQQPTSDETGQPTTSFQPSYVPSNSPSLSVQPSFRPSMFPSQAASETPTVSEQPSFLPSNAPSFSVRPSTTPSISPSLSAQPSLTPSDSPSVQPSTSMQPSQQPSPEFGELELVVPANFTLNEDERLDLSGFVDYIDRVPRGDEEINLEVSNYPEGTKFFLGSREIDTIVDGALLIPATDLSELTMQAPNDFSGRFTIDVRATLRENGIVVVSTDPVENLLVDVLPVADNTGTVRMSVVEDQSGPILLGSEIRDRFEIQDVATSAGNNNVNETIIEFRIKIPEDTDVFNHTVGGFFGDLTGTGKVAGEGTAEIIFDATPAVREYIIRSTIVPNGADSNSTELLGISQSERETASTDILATLALFELSAIGPAHTDLDGDLTVTAVTADVNTEVSSEDSPLGAADTTETTWKPLRVQAIADKPTVQVISPAGTITEEDDENIPLFINVTSSADVDDSEVLSVKITIPKEMIFSPVEALTPIGEIQYIGDLPEGVTLTLVEDNAWLIEADGDSPSIREMRLNEVLSEGNLVFNPRFGWAGKIMDEDGLFVELISTERANNDQVAPPEFGGEDGDSKREADSAYIGIEVIAVADVPTVEIKGNAIGLEDVSYLTKQYQLKYDLLTSENCR